MNPRYLLLSLVTGAILAALGLAIEPDSETATTESETPRATLGFEEINPGFEEAIIEVPFGKDGKGQQNLPPLPPPPLAAASARTDAKPCTGGTCANDCGAETTWSVQTGIISLRRHTNGSIPVVVGAYNTSDLQLEHENGPLLSLVGFVGGGPWGFDLTYFRANDMSAEAAGIGTLAGFIPASAPFATAYSSSLTSLELNLRRRVLPELTLLAGIRRITVDELLRHRVPLAPTFAYWLETENDLAGGQLGLDAVLWRIGPFSLETAAKAGLYTNRAEGRASFSPGGGPIASVSTRDLRTAFAGEFGLAGVWTIGQHFSIRGGYQLLWLDGITIAPEQADNNNVLAGVGTVDGTRALYHGFTLSLGFSW